MEDRKCHICGTSNLTTGERWHISNKREFCSYLCISVFIENKIMPFVADY